MAARTLYTFLLVLVFALGACKKDDFANETMSELTALTDDIVKTVKDASDKKAGVAEAQKKLDAKKGELAPKLKEIGELRGFQVSEETQVKVGNAMVESMTKMAALEIDLMTALMSDKELDTALDKLIKDHEAMITAIGGE
jgi:hypothetical protein